MKKLALLCTVACSMLAMNTFAATYRGKVALNTVTLKLTADRWVTTKTAKVSIIINAAIKSGGLNELRSSVLKHLSGLYAPKHWHITRFSRSKGKSGLEQIQIQASSRMPQAKLNGLQNKVEKLSKPGRSYRISNIDFSPSNAEREQARAALRRVIYHKAGVEVAALDKQFPKQQYFLNKLQFNDVPVVVAQRGNNGFMATEFTMNRMPMPKKYSNSSLAVSNKLELSAYVTVASRIPSQVEAKVK